VWFAVTITPLRQPIPLEGTRIRACTLTTERPACSAAVASSSENLLSTDSDMFVLSYVF
jgi:hypothetical protein